MSFESYYNEENSALSLAIFGPYMLKHGMAFPKIWEGKIISPYKIILFKLLDSLEKYIGLKTIIEMVLIKKYMQN